MKKFFFNLKASTLVAFAALGAGSFLFTACSDNDSPSEPVDKVTDLSAVEMANCYIVQSPGIYKFKADNRFNLGPGLPVPPEIAPDSAKLVWQTVPGTIKSVELLDAGGNPYIQFEVVNPAGNALIAALDESGTIVWSWHIWMPEEKVEGIMMENGYEVMNMNLGAMNNNPGEASSYGMLYQWGRKDPFPAAATPTGDTSTVGAPLYDMEGNQDWIVNSSWYNNGDNTIDYAIAHPMVVISNYSQYASSRDWLKTGTSDDSLWGNPQGDVRDSDNNTYPNSGRKTCYDPSPAGWRVAPADAFRNFTSTGGYVWTFEDFNVADINGDGVIDMGDYNYGWHFNVADGVSLFFPAAARYDGSYGMLMGSVSGFWGSYWCNAPYSSVPGGGFSGLSFQVKDQSGNDMTTMTASGGGSRADAYSIRCVRDTK